MAADGHEVGHRRGKGDLEGEVVDGDEAGDLVSVARGHLGVAGDRCEVVADLGRGGHGGVGETLPAALEGSGVHGVAVVEGHALTQGEGVGETVLGDGRELRGAHRHGLVDAPVPRHQAVEARAHDRGALVLLRVVRVNVRRLGEVERHVVLADRGGSRRSGAGRTGAAAVVGAARERSQGARRKGAAHELATIHVDACHAFLLRMWMRLCASFTPSSPKSRKHRHALWARNA